MLVGVGHFFRRKIFHGVEQLRDNFLKSKPRNGVKLFKRPLPRRESFAVRTEHLRPKFSVGFGLNRREQNIFAQGIFARKQVIKVFVEGFAAQIFVDGEWQINVDGFILPDSINAVGRLIFLGGIPRASEVNDVIRRRYREADARRLRRENKRVEAVRSLELVDKALTRRAVHRPVNRRQNFQAEFFFEQVFQYRLHFPIRDEEQNFFAASFYLVEERESFNQPRRTPDYFVRAQHEKFFFGQRAQVGVQ